MRVQWSLPPNGAVGPVGWTDASGGPPLHLGLVTWWHLWRCWLTTTKVSEVWVSSSGRHARPRLGSLPVEGMPSRDWGSLPVEGMPGRCWGLFQWKGLQGEVSFASYAAQLQRHYVHLGLKRIPRRMYSRTTHAAYSVPCFTYAVWCSRMSFPGAVACASSCAPGLGLSFKADK